MVVATHDREGAAFAAPAKLPGAPILSVKGVSKSFPGVKALRAVDFDVRPGEVHALCGENGAGKSTLMRILAGNYQADEGEISLRGQPARYRNPREARAEGILLIHQEISLVPEMSVAENIFLGSLPHRTGIVSRRDMHQRVKNLLDAAGGEFRRIDPRAKVSSLSFAFQQMVEIARASAFNSAVVIFDEPTASLTLSEAQSLFRTIAELKAKGVAIVYISHKMSEIFALADRITVLRDGAMRGTLAAAETSEAEVTRLMIGRDLEPHQARATAPGVEELLRLEDFHVPNFVRGVSLSVKRGEVLGLYGLVGAGRTELMESVFGVRRKTAGRVFWKGAEARIRSPKDAVELGMGLVPEDRKGKGLVLGLSAISNLTLAMMRRAGLFRRQDRAGERRVYDAFKARLDIRAAGPDVAVGTLSGGNQQKIALAKWLAMEPTLLVLDEPTRGIDVGAKAEIHALISRLAEEGMSIVLISSELPEILALSTRVLTFSEGRLTGEFDGPTATEEMLLSAVVGRRG
jgi:ABC-type sugar transport system ATPase subunit